jgi:hypothetical protein
MINIETTMKLKSNLTKRYYYPIVEGSNNGFINSKFKAYLNYYETGDGLVKKISNYSQFWHWHEHKPINLRKGYNMSWWEGSKAVQKELIKANKYLNRNYNRMDKHISKGEIDKAVAIWRILHTRSMFWRKVLIVRKLPFLSMTVQEIKKLVEKLTRLMGNESTKLRITRIFLKEYNEDGSVKKYRPLGVPSKEWRVISASYEFLLVNLWKKTWPSNQFACMPGQGAGDAWMEILMRISTGKVNEIIGYDLAKFFDLVYIKNIDYMNLPDFLTEYFRKLVRRKPQVSREDKEMEKKRIKATEEERVIPKESEQQYILEDLLLKANGYSGGRGPFPGKEAQKNEAPYISMPQGLSTSPIMCCRALQLTGSLDHPSIIQYVDDGVILNTEEEKITIDEFKASLNAKWTGICISEKKTEKIMEQGKYLKPLKFLGCEFDGETLRGCSRKGGIHEAENAKKRTREIMKWLKLHPNRASWTEEIWLESKLIKEKLNLLIADGWDKSIKNKSLVPLDHPMLQYKGQTLFTFDPKWTKVEILKEESLEIHALKKVIQKENWFGDRIMASTNTVSMIGSYFLLMNLYDPDKYKNIQEGEDQQIRMIQEGDKIISMEGVSFEPFKEEVKGKIRISNSEERKEENMTLAQMILEVGKYYIDIIRIEYFYYRRKFKYALWLMMSHFKSQINDDIWNNWCQPVLFKISKVLKDLRT